jgi:hypothetical protein
MQHRSNEHNDNDQSLPPYEGAFAHAYACAYARIVAAHVQRVQHAMHTGAYTIRRGTFYPGGPLCIALYDAAGHYVDSVTVADCEQHCAS